MWPLVQESETYSDEESLAKKSRGNEGMLAKDQKNTRNNVSLVVWKRKQGIDVFNMGLNISS